MGSFSFPHFDNLKTTRLFPGGSSMTQPYARQKSVSDADLNQFFKRRAWPWIRSWIYHHFDGHFATAAQFTTTTDDSISHLGFYRHRKTTKTVAMWHSSRSLPNKHAFLNLAKKLCRPRNKNVIATLLFFLTHLTFCGSWDLDIALSHVAIWMQKHEEHLSIGHKTGRWWWFVCTGPFSDHTTSPLLKPGGVTVSLPAQPV